jgi:hypothetical protein
MNNPKPKRHHYVPQFYLEYFACEVAPRRRILWVYDKDGGEPRAQTPRDTAVESGYYSIETKTGKTVVIEELLSKLETATAPILRRFQDSDEALSEPDIPVLAEFLAMLHLRGPRMLQVTSEFLTAHAYHFAENTAAQPEMVRKYIREKGAEMAFSGKPIPKEEELIESLSNAQEKFDIVVDRQYALLESLKACLVITKILYQMNWCLCRAPKNTFFLTSDSPLCVLAKTERGGLLFGSGFDRNNVQITFPISPHAAILIDRRHSQRRMAVGEAFVREANRNMALYAQRYVISHLSTRATLELALWASQTRTIPKLDRKVVMAELAARQDKSSG